MSYLLYCIFGSSVEPDLRIPPGVGGKPVFVVAHDGLSAALSELSESPLAPDALQTVAYERVVEAFHGSTSVIPMRYGCQITDQAEVVRLLEKRREEYETLLRELAGVVEMGIQVLPRASGSEREAQPFPTISPATMTGAAYLEARRQYFLRLDQADLDQRRLVADLCNRLAGVYVHHKVAVPDSRSGHPLLAYFLVPRGSLESFRQVARQLCSRFSLKMLVSGPWPPYNFVDSLASIQRAP